MIVGARLRGQEAQAHRQKTRERRAEGKKTEREVERESSKREVEGARWNEKSGRVIEERR